MNCRLNVRSASVFFLELAVVSGVWESINLKTESRKKKSIQRFRIWPRVIEIQKSLPSGFSTLRGGVPTGLRPLASVLCLLPLAWLWFVTIDQLRVEWTLNPQYSYGWVVPFLGVVLLIRGSQEANGSPAPSSILHLPSSLLLPLVALCALLYAPIRLIEIANPDWRLVSWGLALIAVGITLGILRLALGASRIQISAFSFQFSDFIFPIFFFLVAVPWPTLIEGPLIQEFTRADTSITTELMGWLGIPAIAHGSVIEVATGLVGIDEACSGIRSFQATLMISLFLGQWYRLNMPRRLALVLGGFGLSFLFNLTRMSLLVWVASREGVGAISSWHDPAGVTILVACFLCLWALGSWMEKRGGRKSEGGRWKSAVGEQMQTKPHHCTGYPLPSDNGARSIAPQAECDATGGAMLRAPAAIESRPVGVASKIPPAFTVGLIVWIALTEIGVEWWYRSHEASLPPAVKWTVNQPENERVQEIAIAPRSRQILRYDEGHDFAWADSDGLRWNVIYLRWNPGRVAAYLARNHTPEVCLSAAGRKLISASPLERISVCGLELPFYHYVFDDGPNRLNVFYCLWSDRAVRQDFGTASLDYHRRLAAVRDGLRNLGQRSLEIALAGASSPETAEAAVREEVERLVRVQSPQSPVLSSGLNVQN